MKFSIVLGLNESTSSEKQVLERFTESCNFLSTLGYQGIELAILEPEKIPVEKIREIAIDYKMKIPAIGTGSTFIRFGYSLGDVNPKVREKAIERIKKYLDFSSVSESLIIIGLLRGRYSRDSDSKSAKENIIKSLRICCKLAEDSGLNLLLEPINRFEIDSCNTIQETLEMIEVVGSNNLKLMIDSFHIHLEEDPTKIWSFLKTIADKVSHIHLADDTRRAPGTGHFDFQRFLQIFNESAYKGFASMETIMKPSFKEVASKSIKFLRSIL